MLSEGDKAPNFKLKSDEGHTVSLSDFLGKKVVLYFFSKDHTPGCTAEACSFRDNIKLLESKGVVVIGVSKDSVQSHQKFKEEYSLPFTLLSDEKKITFDDYGVWQEINLYGKTVFGVKRTTFIIGADGTILKILSDIKAKDHVEEVLKHI
jgi:peroxiredoxin Q/BCP